MPPQKFPAVSITLRPAAGVSTKIIDRFLVFTERYATEARVITHKSGTERHIHAIWFLKKEKAKGDFCTSGKVLHKEWKREWEEEGSVWGVACKVKGVYNDDWYSKYLFDVKEGDDPMVVLTDTVTMKKDQRMEKYIDVIQKEDSRANWWKFKWEKQWYVENPDKSDPTLFDIEKFLCKHMYQVRDLKTIDNPRLFKTTCYGLKAFIEKAETYPWHGHLYLHDD